jgi:hypothetical protein
MSYVPNSNTEFFHGTTRGGNPNTLILEENESDYFVGLVISGVAFLILALLYCVGVPFYMCCCRKAKEKTFAQIKKRIIFFAVCLGE